MIIVRGAGEAAKKVAFTLAEGATHVAHCDKSRRVAFTLAEVLITLGIIGVVAALTLPVLVQNYNESKTINILKQSQSILGQALEMAINENGDLSNWGIKHVYSTKESDSIIIAEKLKPFLKLMDDCGTFDSNGKCCPNVTYKYLNGNNY